FYFTDHKVANTVAKTVLEEYITLEVIFAGLIAAIGWNLFTWYYGVPSSSSHTLIGGFAGAGMTHAFILGYTVMGAINLNASLRILSLIVFAALLGMIIGITITVIIINISKRANPSVAEWWFQKLQLVSSAALSFAHGGNDAQKVMGIIFVAMVAGGYLQSD